MKEDKKALDNRSKFEIIYTNYKGLMFYVADQILQNRHDAEDAVRKAIQRAKERLQNELAKQGITI